MLPRRPAMEDRLMTRPQPRACMGGTKRLQVLNTPLRFTSITASQSSSEMLAMVFCRAMPALFTRMSTWPMLSIAFS